MAIFVRGTIIPAVVRVLCGAILLCASVSGCESILDGNPVRAAGPKVVEPPKLTEEDLDNILLDVGAVNGIMDARGMEITTSSREMSDNSDAVSDQDCLASIYSAEQLVYAGTGWTAVRDQVLQEPDDDNRHWVEQAAVLYPSQAKAQEFAAGSKKTWDDCGGTSIDIDNGHLHATWDIEDADYESHDEAGVSTSMLTQVTAQRQAGGWACQHAMSTYSNVVAEVWACSYDIKDEARSIAEQIIENAR